MVLVAVEYQLQSVQIISVTTYNSLLHRFYSPSSAKDQAEAAEELCREAKRFNNVRTFFVAEIADSITRLLTHLSSLGEEVDSNPELQKKILTDIG